MYIFFSAVELGDTKTINFQFLIEMYRTENQYADKTVTLKSDTDSAMFSSKYFQKFDAMVTIETFGYPLILSTRLYSTRLFLSDSGPFHHLSLYLSVYRMLLNFVILLIMRGVWAFFLS